MKNYNKSATIQDRKVYAAGEEIPDLSSWECVDNSNGKHTYWGLAADVSKLPTYCPTGSKALCLDTGDAYLWHGGTRQWYAFGSTPPSSGGGDVDLNSLDWDDVAAYEGVLFEKNTVDGFTTDDEMLSDGSTYIGTWLPNIPIILGETYNVHYDGVDYPNLVCDQYYTIGNGHIFSNSYEDTGEPFVICYTPIGLVLVTNNMETTSVVFSLEGKSYTTVPSEYVPIAQVVMKGTGYNSLRIGNPKNVASDEFDCAEGSGTKATGGSCHAEGYQTTASAYAAHSEGETATASGRGAHAEGWYTIASGEYSHAEGAYAIASGGGAHAEGGYDAYAPMFEMQTVASGNGSHAEGFNTTASGDYSHSEGLTTTASGYKSHAEGDHTIASTENQHVQGSYNIEDTEHKYLHIIGNGTAFNKRSNAHTVDHKGNAWYAADVYVGGTSQDDASKLATEDFVKEYLGVIENGTY